MNLDTVADMARHNGAEQQGGDRNGGQPGLPRSGHRSGHSR
jgi:hypothetical protein